jgi:hypothetical protein
MRDGFEPQSPQGKGLETFGKGRVPSIGKHIALPIIEAVHDIAHLIAHRRIPGQTGNNLEGKEGREEEEPIPRRGPRLAVEERHGFKPFDGFKNREKVSPQGAQCKMSGVFEVFFPARSCRFAHKPYSNRFLKILQRRKNRFLGRREQVL